MAVEVLDPTLVALADDEDHVETIVGMRLLDGALDGLHTIDDHRGIHMVVGDMAEHFVADVDIRFGIGVFGGEYETCDAILCGLDDFLTAVERLVAGGTGDERNPRLALAVALFDEIDQRTYAGVVVRIIDDGHGVAIRAGEQFHTSRYMHRFHGMHGGRIEWHTGLMRQCDGGEGVRIVEIASQ